MTAFVPDPESRRDVVSDGCQTTCADKVNIDDLYNAFLNPGSSSGSRGAGRIASVMGEHGEGLAEIIFGPLIKIQEDPEKKLHSPDFISERLDFIVEVKTGVIKPKGCPIGEMDSGHPSAIQSAVSTPGANFNAFSGICSNMLSQREMDTVGSRPCSDGCQTGPMRSALWDPMSTPD